jgi:hypothetical protein
VLLARYRTSGIGEAELDPAKTGRSRRFIMDFEWRRDVGARTYSPSVSLRLILSRSLSHRPTRSYQVMRPPSRAWDYITWPVGTRMLPQPTDGWVGHNIGALDVLDHPFTECLGQTLRLLGDPAPGHFQTAIPSAMSVAHPEIWIIKSNGV